ncbi:Beta-barrel assembly machine subunit BamD [Andreprevotia lacus DSM 23236]|jgi:outer membrane protein assembly factor BamD|uniref:Outer membrane protein assembly factor BamD n=1 Tax=Andreprevotia lacus DSM 23236 TaxID=1121001 RepID=A0A1W1XRK9_9NEIS|nr:outer membrane protein assembly factor BamD [Andreprevotia lacus]SMC26161.1 Beta-barrel assembly machine subunit BamD [Andreprevotia lacus DSM 23236]
MKQILPRFFQASLLAVLIAGCAATPKDNDETKGWSAEKLFSEAKAEQASRNYAKSIQLFEKLEARYPYGKYAQQAQLEIAYDQYKDKEPVLALAAIDRFIKSNPAHPSMDYALYLKGLVSFNEVQGFGSAVFQQDMSERDPKAERDSYEAFRTLIARFPESRYAGDAAARMDYLIGALANYELHVARYYYRRGAYLAAANRGKALIETYPKTKQVEGGLGMMVLAYDKLGMDTLRDDAKRVLLKNYPKTQVLDGTLLEEMPWWRPW